MQEPRRDEPFWQVVAPDSLIALVHPACLMWSFVRSLELSELYAFIKACSHTVERAPIDRCLLLALWLPCRQRARDPAPVPAQSRLSLAVRRRWVQRPCYARLQLRPCATSPARSIASGGSRNAAMAYSGLR